MRPYQTDYVEMLWMARARAEELLDDWQTANRGRPGRVPTGAGRGAAVMRLARGVAGRTLIGLGRRVLPVDVEPCGQPGSRGRRESWA
jgi:hypothetical protein